MSAKLFVGNLTFTATENDLQDHFAQAGVVVSVNIMQDRMTGRSRGFAFIEMSSKEDAEKAIQMFHSKDFQGRPLTVNEARPREERPPGGGGRRVSRRWWRRRRVSRRRGWRTARWRRRRRVSLISRPGPPRRMSESVFRRTCLDSKSPFGSRLFLICRCRARSAGDAARGHHGFLASPMPCSPVMTPRHATTCRNNSSRTARLRDWARGQFLSYMTLTWMLPSPAWPKQAMGHARFLLQTGGEREKVLQPAARDHDVLVEFGQSGVAQGEGEFAAQLPEDLALFAVHKRAGGGWGGWARSSFSSDGSFAADRLLLAIQLHHDHGAQAVELPAAGPAAGRRQSELIGDFQGGRAKSRPRKWRGWRGPPPAWNRTRPPAAPGKGGRE